MSTAASGDRGSVVGPDPRQTGGRLDRALQCATRTGPDDVAALLAPGAPPWGWVSRTVLIVGGTAGFIVALAVAGVVLRDDPGRGFAEGKPGTLASVALLAWAGVLSARIAWRGGAPGAGRWFWGLASAALVLLAIDDSFMLHERVDFAIHAALGWDPDDPVTDRIDDVLVGCYGIVGAGAAWRCRRGLMRMPWLMYPAAAAGALFAVMVVLDVADRGGMALEEGAKLLAGACIVSGLYGALLDPATLRGARGCAGERGRSST